MTTIDSPTTGARIARTLITAAGVAVFSLWFLYDGYIGYPRRNLAKAVESLNPVPDELPATEPRVTQQAADRLAADLHTRTLTRTDIRGRLGPPGWRNELGDDVRYFGPGGMLRISFDGDVVKDMFYTPGQKDDVELAWQKLLGFGLLPVAVLLIFQTVRVLRARFVLSDHGLKLPGKPLIPFDAMSELDGGNYQARGVVDLRYAVGGRPRRARLDAYVIRDHRAIVTEICARCGFDNPLPPPERDKATPSRQD